MAIIWFIIFLSTVLPIFHMLNALLNNKKTVNRKKSEEKEEKFTIIIPCYNEEKVLPLSIQGISKIDYRNYEVIYINDGSTDNTFEVLNKTLYLKRIYNFKHKNAKDYNMEFYRSLKFKNFYVINKFNEGKGESINCGIYFACSKLIVTLDADSVLEKNALNHMNQAFKDENVVAAGGAIYIMQGFNAQYRNGYSRKTRRLIAVQILDYLKGFFIYKFSLNVQNATAIISGAFGVFRRDILVAAGGFRKSLGEDIDITLNIQFLIQNTQKKIRYLPQAICFTQCPETWTNLKRQRIRWQKGFINCLEYYRAVILKTFLYKSLTFHLLIEAFVVAITSSYFTLATFVVLALSDNIDTLVVFIWYLLTRIIIQSLYSICAIQISKKYYAYPKNLMKHVYAVIIFDLLVFQMFTMFIYLMGTFSYFWNSIGSHDWNKFDRSPSSYFMDDEKG